MAETTPQLPKSDQNLIWLDCEMTGLEPDVERIIEIAVIVTGPNLEPRVEGPVLVIHQPVCAQRRLSHVWQQHRARPAVSGEVHAEAGSFFSLPQSGRQHAQGTVQALAAVGI